MRKWIIVFAILCFSAPMWAKFITPDVPEFAEGKEYPNEEETAEDVLPIPSEEKEKETVEAPKPVTTPSIEKPAAPSTPVKTEFANVWRPPVYSGQEKALGYSETAFAVPKGMQDRVQFWTDIYTKYTNDQGVLHDSKYINLIYETVDLTDITNSLIMTAHQKDKAKRDRIKKAKEAIADRLHSLEKVKDASELTGEDLRYWKLFAAIDDEDKFSEAAKKGRLRFQAGQKDQFIRGITQSGRYLRQMEEIFREEGLPVELTRMPFVESSFNLNARSKVGASGIWQFMRSSGRLYLRMDDVCDDRNDPIRATRAAARKLRQEYAMQQSWPLTVTGWNHGAAGIRRLVEHAKTKDIAELTDMRRGRFGFASANFYASFLAALEVERNAGHYFGILPVLAEVRGEDIRLEKELPMSQLLKWFNDDIDIAKLYNPHLKPHVWTKHPHLHKRDFIRVPTDIVAKVNLDLRGASATN